MVASENARSLREISKAQAPIDRNEWDGEDVLYDAMIERKVIYAF